MGILERITEVFPWTNIVIENCTDKNKWTRLLYSVKYYSFFVYKIIFNSYLYICKTK